MPKRPFIPYAPRPEGWTPPVSRAKAEAIAADKRGSTTEVGKRHGVSSGTVSRIRTGKHWLQLGPLTELMKDGIRPNFGDRPRKRG